MTYKFVRIYSSNNISEYSIIDIKGCKITQHTFLTLLCKEDYNFISEFCSELRSYYDKYECFMIECNPMKLSTLDKQEFSFALIRSERLNIVSEDCKPFNHYISKYKHELVCYFDNLGGDAKLIIPVKHNYMREDFSSIGRFIKTSSDYHQLSFWNIVGKVMIDELLKDENKILWLSTNGLSVHYTHIRIDTRPKYYNYDKYRNISHLYNEASNSEFSHHSKYYSSVDKNNNWSKNNYQ